MIIASITTIGIVYFLAVFALAVALLFLNDWIFHRRPNKKEMAAFSKHFEERLLKPDIQALEQHFEHALPQALKTFYSSQEEILRENIEVIGTNSSGEKTVWNIAFFQPADLENVREAWPDTKQVFEFANDGFGNGYTIDPKLENPPVMFYDHETREWEKVADNFEDFLGMVRRQTKQ